MELCGLEGQSPQLDVELLREKDVGRLDVAVHHLLRVDRVQSGGQLRGPPQERGDGQVLCRLPRGDDLMVERAARGVIGDDAEHLVLQEARAVADDVLLILEAHQRGDLALQPSEVGPAAAAARPRLLDHRKVDARAVPEEHRLSSSPSRGRAAAPSSARTRPPATTTRRPTACPSRSATPPRLLDGRRVAALARLAPLVVARQLLDLRLDAADDRAVAAVSLCCPPWNDASCF